MTSETINVLNAALALPEADRLKIANELLASVKPPGVWSVDDPGFAEELQRRLDSIESGEAELIDGDEAMRMLRESLSKKCGQ